MEYICPHCKKPIYDDDALLCLYCGESLRRPIGKFGKAKYGFNPAVLFFIIAIVISAFIVLLIF